jgi:acyl-CoA synthetase (AMP-forming)/AMP-acid ligase II
MLIHHFLERSSLAFPDKVSLVHGKTNASYRQINSCANQLAHWLIGQGAGPGDRIALLMENCLEYVISYYGVLKTGAAVAPLSSGLKPEGLQPLLARLSPKVLLAGSRFERLLKATVNDELSGGSIVIKDPRLEWRPNSRVEILDWNAALDGQPDENLNVDVDPTALASIVFTSGSAGMPKGVMLTHQNIASNTLSICRYLELTADDVQMVVLPFHYVMGKSLLNTHVAVGGRVIINNRFAYPATVIEEMVDQKVTGFSGVPSTYAYLLHRSPLVALRDQLKSLRYCSQAGGHMARKTKENLRKALPSHTRIVIMYGATEAAARLTYLPSEHFGEKMDSIGIPIPNVKIRILDTSGLELPAGQVGELVAAGPNIMQGYWQEPESTRMVLDADGCYHTGDIGYRDDDGFLYLMGRGDDQIKVGGHRINPCEIEDILMESGHVIEAAVLGVEDELLGNRLCAVVAPADENDCECLSKTLLQACAAALPRFKLPAEIKTLRSLPKNDSGKVDRRKCLSLFQNHRPV